MLISSVQVNTFPFVCFEYEVDNIKLSFKANKMQKIRLSCLVGSELIPSSPLFCSIQDLNVDCCANQRFCYPPVNFWGYFQIVIQTTRWFKAEMSQCFSFQTHESVQQATLLPHHHHLKFSSNGSQFVCSSAVDNFISNVFDVSTFFLLDLNEGQMSEQIFKLKTRN